MRTNSQAPLQFVKSPLIAKNYPAAFINSQNDELYSAMQFVEHLLPNVAIIVCQRSENPSVQYASANCKKVFGHDPQAIEKMKLPDFLTLVHPEDIEEVERCFAFINASEPYDPLLYRFEIHYRLRHGKGHYINVVDEKLAMKCKGGDYAYINSIKDVTFTAKFHDVKMNVYQLVRGEYKKTQTYIPRTSKSDLTPRQKDIVNLISRGFTNQEIAQEMSVSINTVKNHKSLLFRKVRVKSTIELLNIAQSLYTD
jgi:DNA-binding CsgD family transcriptional regulator